MSERSYCPSAKKDALSNKLQTANREPCDSLRRGLRGGLSSYPRSRLSDHIKNLQRFPDPQGLPDCLRPLLDSRAYDLKDEYWERDTSYFIKRLEELGIPRASSDSTSANIPYPVPIDTSKELDRK